MTQNDPRRLYEQALAAQKSGDLGEAERCYRRLTGLTPAPEALVNHGNVLARLGRRDEALARYDAALAANGALVPGLFNRANLLSDLKRPEDALADYDRACGLRADIAGIWNNRGTALRALHRLPEALASFERAAALDFHEQALAADPRHPHALNGAAAAALALCDWTRTAAFRPRLEEEVRRGRAVIQPFTLLGYGADAALQRRCAESHVARSVPRPAPLWSGETYRHDKIRLAYLSADFHQHPTAVLLAELFERHDRDRFEITAIAFGRDDGSAMRARLVKAFDRFEDVRGHSDAEAARLMRAREIDIAVDLNGHTQDGRPGILAWRPAPVAVNYLVYPGTTGAPFIDHILADRVVLPLARQPFYSEKIVHLPHCYQANDATRTIAPAPGRADCGLPRTEFVFCCFNAGWKITPPVFDIWMRLLRQVRDSVLWLLDGPHAENLRREARIRDIDPARLVFAPKIEASRHLARHAVADLFLDTWPYNAHTTASDALWAGLPLVTRIGENFPGRVAASLLAAIGLENLIAETAAGYHDLALRLAREPERLRAARGTLARNRLQAPLYDSDRFRRDIEAVYQSLRG